MSGKTNLRNSLFEMPGYSTALRLSEFELSELRSRINKSYRKRVCEFQKTDKCQSIENYHELGVENHSDMWPKSARFIPHDDVDFIKTFGFLKTIRDELGNFEISKQVDQNGVLHDNEEIYWRLVRPNAPTDIGPIHADVWFAETLDYGDSMFNGRDTLKAWVPIYVERGLNGLSVVPNSHTQDWDYEVVSKNGYQRPSILSEVESEVVPTDPGQIVLFGDKLLHGGVVNVGKKCRVSMEITLVFDEPLPKAA